VLSEIKLSSTEDGIAALELMEVIHKLEGFNQACDFIKGNEPHVLTQALGQLYDYQELLINKLKEKQNEN